MDSGVPAESVNQSLESALMAILVRVQSAVVTDAHLVGEQVAGQHGTEINGRRVDLQMAGRR
jgi:metallophosphoesterase superfamily enzyme